MPIIRHVAIHITPYKNPYRKRGILYGVRYFSPQHMARSKRNSIPGTVRLVAFLKELGTPPEKIYTFLDELPKPSTAVLFDQLDTEELERYTSGSLSETQYLRLDDDWTERNER